MPTYATFDSNLKGASATLSGGNKVVTRAAGSGYQGVAAKANGQSSGKWYCEFVVNADATTSTNLGLAPRTQFPTANYFGSGTENYGLHGYGDFLGPSGGNPWSYTGYSPGDVISVLYDGDANTVEFWENGVSVHSATTIQDLAYVPGVVVYTTGDSFTARFDPAEWAYTPPAGYAGWESYDVTSTVAETLPLYSLDTGFTMVETLPPYLLDTGFTMVETLPMYQLDTGYWAANTLPVYFLDTGILVDLGPSGPTLSADIINDPPETRLFPMYVLDTGLTMVGVFPAHTLATSVTLRLNDIEATGPMPVVSADGVVGSVATAEQFLPAYTLDSRTDGLLLELPAFLLTAVAYGGQVAAVGQTLPAPYVESSASLAVNAYADAQIARLRISASAFLNPTSSFAHETPTPYLAATGVTGSASSLSEALPMYNIALVAYGAYVLDAALELPVPEIESDVSAFIALVFRTWALTVGNRGLTEYDNFDFNSYAVFNGKVIAASSTGIHELSGQALDESDNAVFDKIPSLVRTAKENFGTSYNKRVPRIYAAYSSDGPLKFSTIISHDGKRTYLLPDNGLVGVQQRRVPVGRGPKAPYWQFEVENVEGADFTLDHLIVYPEKSYRRVL